MPRDNYSEPHIERISVLADAFSYLRTNNGVPALGGEQSFNQVHLEDLATHADAIAVTTSNLVHEKLFYRAGILLRQTVNAHRGRPPDVGMSDYKDMFKSLAEIVGKQEDVTNAVVLNVDDIKVLDVCKSALQHLLKNNGKPTPGSPYGQTGLKMLGRNAEAIAEKFDSTSHEVSVLRMIANGFAEVVEAYDSNKETNFSHVAAVDLITSLTAIITTQSERIRTQGVMHTKRMMARKAAQNPHTLDYMKSFGDRYIVEGAHYDPVWGVKLAWNDPAIIDPVNWRGTNWLGEVLMEVRKRLV